MFARAYELESESCVRLQVWNEEECVGTLKAHTGVVSALAFDQDWLYSSSWDGFVKVFCILPFSQAPQSVVWSVSCEQEFERSECNLCCRM